MDGHPDRSQPPDARVEAVLAVLAGRDRDEVAEAWSLDALLLDRWVDAFVDAGTARVTNRPLEQEAAQRDRFLAAFAHELRTPLTTARGWVRMLHSDAPEEIRAESLTRLDDSLGRLADRTMDVELLARAALGRLDLRRLPVPLTQVIAQVPDLAALRPDLLLDPKVLVDPSLFALVLRDLLLAARSAPTPRRLTLEVEVVDPWAEIRLRRDADPIHPRVLQALFEPFDLNDDATGVTIGLYLARALTVAHGGTLGADQDDEHAVLWVRVPLARTPAVT